MPKPKPATVPVPDILAEQQRQFLMLDSWDLSTACKLAHAILPSTEDVTLAYPTEAVDESTRKAAIELALWARSAIDGGAAWGRCDCIEGTSHLPTRYAKAAGVVTHSWVDRSYLITDRGAFLVWAETKGRNVPEWLRELMPQVTDWPDMTDLQRRICEELDRNPGQILCDLAGAVVNVNAAPKSDNTMKKAIAGLKRLGLVENVRGSGYQLTRRPARPVTT